MSMYFTPSTSAAHALADAVYQRRLDLGLSITEAAELASLSLWQWAALEQALWIPEEGPGLRAIADTLQGNYAAVSSLAAISRDNQNRISQR